MPTGSLPRVFFRFCLALVAAMAAIGIVPTVVLAAAPGPVLDTVEAAQAEAAISEPTYLFDDGAVSMAPPVPFQVPALNLVCVATRPEPQISPPCAEDAALVEVVAICDERGATMIEAPYAAPVADARIEAVADCQLAFTAHGEALTSDRDGSPAPPPAASLEPADVGDGLVIDVHATTAMLPETPYEATAGIGIVRLIERPPRFARG